MILFTFPEGHGNCTHKNVAFVRKSEKSGDSSLRIEGGYSNAIVEEYIIKVIWEIRLGKEMTKYERDLVIKLWKSNISKNEFKNDFFTGEFPEQKIISLLERALAERNADDVEYTLSVGALFDLFTENSVSILCKLLVSESHTRHEDIARYLQDLKSPKSIESLYAAALLKLDYLDFDENFALARKCTWALSAINTNESRRKLELLAQCDNEIIRGFAKKRLV